MSSATPPVAPRTDASGPAPGGAVGDAGSLDGFLTADGLTIVADSRNPGPPHPKAESLNYGVGARPGWPSRWRIPYGYAWEGLLAISAKPCTERLSRISALAAVVADIVSAGELVVTFGPDFKVRWRPAPTPARADRLERAVADVVRLGPPGTNLFVSTLVTDVAATLTVDVPPPTGFVLAGGRYDRRDAKTLNRWADRVVVRRAGGARPVLRLDAPDGDGGWHVGLFLVGEQDPTVRLSARSARANPSRFGATTRQVERLVETEASAAAAALPKMGLLGQLNAAVLADGCSVDSETVVALIADGVAALNAAGFEVAAPAGLLRMSSLTRRVQVGGRPAGLADQLALQARVDLDGVTVSAAELSALAAAKSPLVQVGGRWVHVRAGELEAARKLVERCEQGAAARDLLMDDAFDGVDVVVDAQDHLDRVGELGPLIADATPDSSGSWVVDLLMGTKTMTPATVQELPAGVTATLRHYQRDGLDWLTWLESQGAGGVLADDMGLGKTLQVLTRICADHEGTTLVVCPTSLIENWAREAARFTPDLKVATFHGPGRENLLELVEANDVILTSYGLLGRDPEFADIVWHRVVLDEAQAIKNPATKLARAASGLKANHRLALTGTPVENHLGDLWSVVTFAEPGLLGPLKPFRARYVDETPSSEALERLGRLIAPFVLRRSKRDEGIAPELPDRIDVRHDCGLSREQIGAYEATVKGLLEPPTDESQMGRRGRVLSAITKLKQICVHPELLSLPERLTKRSGKIEQLDILVDEILDADEAMVIFTQFASLLPALAKHLEATCHREVLTLDGSMTRRRRQRSVDAFASPAGPPILAASLRAGGVGLNLVRANHVIHLDRWWNPAVEDQASDRAWRIGQERTVMVHRLICPGTLEDRIDALLTEKRAVADTVVSSSQTAVTEMSDADLADLVGLIRDEVIR